MIKMIAIDLDGTMYTTSRTITTRVRESIATGFQAGLQPVIVTGRGRRGAEIALDTLEMDLPYICSAGALVRPGLIGDSIHAWSFHAQAELLQVIDFTRRNETGMIAEPDQGNSYWFGPDSMNEIMDPLTVKEAQRSIRTQNPENDFDRPMLKITLTASPELLADAEKLIREKCPSIHQVYSGIHYIDLTADGVNKGTALRALAVHFGLQPGQIAAIGDQDIDLQMLKFAGLPIAMSNAVPSIHKAANWIAPSNDEDGVAWAIDEILRTNKQEIY
jgi:Cof subfamily protein (haloacid dehalogenase superfamily)